MATTPKAFSIAHGTVGKVTLPPEYGTIFGAGIDVPDTFWKSAPAGAPYYPSFTTDKYWQFHGSIWPLGTYGGPPGKKSGDPGTGNLGLVFDLTKHFGAAGYPMIAPNTQITGVDGWALAESVVPFVAMSLPAGGVSSDKQIQTQIQTYLDAISSLVGELVK